MVKSFTDHAVNTEISFELYKYFSNWVLCRYRYEYGCQAKLAHESHLGLL